MAPQKVIFKTRQVVKNVDQVVKQEQSLAMVQSLMLVSFTTICNLRDLIAIDDLEDREFIFNSQATTSQSSRPGKFKVLSSGKSAVSDKLLKWLEGINEALEKGWLDSTQLSIIPTKHQPEHVIESYTFTFGYGPCDPHDKKSSQQVKSLSVAQNNGPSVTLQNARYEMGKLIRYLIAACQVLPDLPDERFMTMHLFYNEQRPDDWQPAGFGPSTSEEMLIVNNDQWQPRDIKVGEAELGQHRTELHVTYLLPTANDPGRPYNDFKIDSDLHFTEPRQRVKANIGKPMGSKPRSSVPSSQVSENGIQARVSSWTKSQSQLQTEEHQGATGPDAAATGSQCLRQFQSRLGSQPRASQGSRVSRATPVKDSLREKFSQLPVELDLTEHLVKEGIEELPMDFKPEVGARLAASHDRAPFNQCPALSCECGDRDQEGHLMQCLICDNIQHRCCYAAEAKELKQHVCYTCLLSDNDKPGFEVMKHSARLRRLLWKIQKHGKHGSQSEIMRLTGYEKDMFKQLVTDLTDRGLIRHRPKQKPQFVVLNQTVIKQAEPGKILHPLFRIANLYQDTTEQELEEEVPNRAGIEKVLVDAEIRDRPANEGSVLRSDDETVDELASFGPKTPAPKRRSLYNHPSYIPETPVHGRRPHDGNDATTMDPPAKRARQLNSSQAMSPANVSRHG